MDTIPEPFRLGNAPAGSNIQRRGFRVPFGLKDGRVWAPSEVAKGRACGCVCPGCHAPLVAKAQESRRKRPHFAHLIDTGCQTGRESGIHMRAKQLIVERQELLIPAWDGDLIDMPNPPHARDDEGQLHWGRPIDRPARRVDLRDLEVERSFGTYQPDVYARDEEGELLIEIYVTHAVGDRKAERVQAHGRRMVEIDLSRLDRDTPHDLAGFEHAVLGEPANRIWISCPEAVADWQASKQELDGQVVARNREIAQLREQQAKAAEARKMREAQDSKDKEGRKVYMRRLMRAKHAEDLAQLPELTSPDRIARILREYQASAEERVGELLDAVPPAVRSACLRAHEHAWVFGVDPALWQLLTYEHFVASQPSGSRFNQKDVATWVRRSFHPEMALYRLFVAQYANRAETRRAGYFKWRLAYWVFTDEENDRIPGFYVPVNDFIDRLESAYLIRRLPVPVGEREVLPMPPSGFSPVAVVA
ncbi:competence protein CoiA family protein [Luteimonas mephitis]|uniref:competence protein CoiA family protein n=1 Tax=Luteimonas mephitis TaxID=83615 RepID=UPI0004191F6C|nr:competence protein CoiA family protein [Luteimonas mephitis]